MHLSRVNLPKPRLAVVELLLTMTALVNPLLAQQSHNALFNAKNLDGWEHVGPDPWLCKTG
jgi:hypothetical protein